MLLFFDTNTISAIIYLKTEIAFNCFEIPIFNHKKCVYICEDFLIVTEYVSIYENTFLPKIVHWSAYILLDVSTILIVV